MERHEEIIYRGRKKRGKGNSTAVEPPRLIFLPLCTPATRCLSSIATRCPALSTLFLRRSSAQVGGESPIETVLPFSGENLAVTCICTARNQGEKGSTTGHTLRARHFLHGHFASLQRRHPGIFVLHAADRVLRPNSLLRSCCIKCRENLAQNNEIKLSQLHILFKKFIFVDEFWLINARNSLTVRSTLAETYLQIWNELSYERLIFLQKTNT